MNLSTEPAVLRDVHAKVMLVVLGCLALLGSLWSPDISTQVVLMSAGVATIGMGHGAMDHRVGKILMRPRFGRSWWAVFTTLYLLLAGAAFVGWMAVPAVALVLFLVYSAVHFGSDRYQQGGIIHAAARGAIPILLPIVFHAEEVSKLFSTIASTDINIVQYRIAAGVLAAVAVLFTVAVAFRREKYVSAAEAALLVALNFTCPPLIAFTVYFVLLHSIRHIIELAGWLEPDSLARGFYRIMRQSLVVTGLIMAAGAAAFALISADDVEPAIIRAVFVGLSCLTVPHMVVTHLAEKRIGRESARGQARYLCDSALGVLQDNKSTQ